MCPSWLLSMQHTATVGFGFPVRAGRVPERFRPACGVSIGSVTYLYPVGGATCASGRRRERSRLGGHRSSAVASDFVLNGSVGADDRRTCRNRAEKSARCDLDFRPVACYNTRIHHESDAEAEGNAGMSIMQRAARRRARIRRAALSGAVLAVAVCLFAGCRGIPDGFVGGETLTPEKLREISAAVFTDPAEPDTQPPVADPVLAAYAGRVYWLEGGTVAHTDRNCYHINRSEDVRSGSPADAVAAGKTTLCTACRGHLTGAGSETAVGHTE